MDMATIQTRGKVAVTISAELNYSAYAARRKVDTYVMNHISYMLFADDPQLLIQNKVYWRVPIVLSLTSQGRVGTVGTIDLDANTGQIVITHDQIEALKSNAEALATRSTSTAVA